MRVWLVLNYDTIDPGDVVLAVCASEAEARGLIRHKVEELGGVERNAVAAAWSRCAIESRRVLGA